MATELGQTKLPRPWVRLTGGRADRDRVDVTARAVIESAADAIVAYGTDRTVMLWNPAAERMCGWAAEGRTFHMLHQKAKYATYVSWPGRNRNPLR